MPACSGQVVQGDFRPETTAVGQLHPVTRIGRGGQHSPRLWKQLPRFRTINKTGGALSGASTLVTAKLRGNRGEEIPLIATMEIGEGRSMAIATDSMWRWRFTPIEDGGTAERAYHRFWASALRWLVRDPEHSRVRVVPHQRQIEYGTPALVAVTALDAGYEPALGAAVDLTLRNSAGDPKSAPWP